MWNMHTLAFLLQLTNLLSKLWGGAEVGIVLFPSIHITWKTGLWPVGDTNTEVTVFMNSQRNHKHT